MSIKKQKTLWERVQVTRTFTGLVMLAIGISGTVCYYEGCGLKKDYDRAIRAFESGKVYLEEIKDDKIKEIEVPKAEAKETEVSKPEPDKETKAETVEETIRRVCREENFGNPDLMVRIAWFESNFNKCVKNPASSAIGIFQILDMHGLTREERCNPEIATRWAVKHFNDGNPWNSSRSKWGNNSVAMGKVK